MSDNERSIKIMGTITSFLLVFAPKTLVKRIVAMILLTADVPIPRVVELSGLGLVEKLLNNAKAFNNAGQ